MKKTIILLLAFVSILLNVNAQGFNHEITDHKASKSSKSKSQEIKNFPIKVTISAKPYRPKRDCQRGLGICDVTISVTPGYAVTVGTLFENNDLELEFQEDLHPFFSSGEDLTAIQIDDDESISLSPQVAKSFGKSSITLLPGTYAVDYSASPFGTVRLQTTTN